MDSLKSLNGSRLSWAGLSSHVGRLGDPGHMGSYNPVSGGVRADSLGGGISRLLASGTVVNGRRAGRHRLDCGDVDG